MTVVLDTNVAVQLFGPSTPFAPLKAALLAGRLTVAISTRIGLEYEEVITRYGGPERWRRVAHALDLIAQLHGTVLHIEPSFHFHTIAADADDDAFADCAITAEADYVITNDGHFAVRASAGYKVRAITPEEFIRRHLAGA